MKSLAEYRAVVISEERENESLIRPYDLQAGVENRKNTASDDTRHEKSRPRRRTAADPESADDDDDGRSDDQSCDEKEHHKSVERTYLFLCHFEKGIVSVSGAVICLFLSGRLIGYSVVFILFHNMPPSIKVISN